MKLKVMAVDDEPDVLKLLKVMLERKGCLVNEVVDSREAADRLRQEKVDGLFLDVCMPHIDGFELTRLVRNSKLNAQVPIIMLTGQDDAETMRKGFEVGVSFFLGKPFTRERVYNLFGATRGPMIRERQRYIRLPYQTTVECTWGDYNQGHFKSSSQDVSEGGMLISPSGGLELGREMSIQFSLPNNPHRLKIQAQVIRELPPHSVGVQFLTLAPRDKEAILQYITARTED